MTTNRKLIRSTGIIGSAISTSRVLGFLRDIIFARWFGTNIYAQAFVVAYRIPNMLRDMVGEGATDAALVPVLSEYRHTKTEDEYWRAARSILGILVLVLLPIVALGVIFAPVIVKVIAPGFLKDPELYSAAVVLTRLLFPYIFFLGLVAYSKGVLNSLDHFTMPALASVVLNITIIIALWKLCPIIGVKGMVAGVLAGGLLQVLIQVPPLVKKGFSFAGGISVVHSINKRIGKLLMPRALGTAVYQLSVLVDTVLASLAWIVGEGGPAALYFSNRLVQLPLAVFGISLATAALPKLSREIAMNDMDRFRNTVSFSLRTVFMIMVPAAAGLMVMARPIVRTLFQRGEFTAYSTSITSSALFFYAFGLFAYAGIKILVGTFYSMGDTRTPVKTASAALVVNVVLNLILMWPLKIGGLALATSIAATTNFVILYAVLRKRVGDIDTAGIARSLIRVCAATLVMAAFTYAASGALLGKGVSGVRAVPPLLAVIFSSGMVYFAAAYFFKVAGARRVWRILLSRISGKHR